MGYKVNADTDSRIDLMGSDIYAVGEEIYFSLEYLLACSRNPDESKVVNDAVNAKFVSDVCTAIDFVVEKINLNTMLKYVSKYVETESKIE